MGDDGVENFTAESASAVRSVRNYISQEWTQRGYHCRSENVSQGIFEIVLPQVAPSFSEFMAELIDCGVSSVDFRADAHECRLMVMVDDVSRVPDFVKRSVGIRRYWPYFAVLLTLCLFLAAGVLQSRQLGAKSEF